MLRYGVSLPHTLILTGTRPCTPPQEVHNYRKQDQLFHMVMHLPVALAAVSPAVNDILGGQFRRAPLTVPNGIDCGRFAPGSRADLPPTATVVYPGPQVLRAVKLRALLSCHLYPWYGVGLSG